jgi:hypothetical protein
MYCEPMWKTVCYYILMICTGILFIQYYSWSLVADPALGTGLEDKDADDAIRIALS